MDGISSKLIHGEINSKKKDTFRSLKTPIYDTASYDFENAAEMEQTFRGNTDAYIYSRITNPTVSELQDRMKLFSGAENALCVSSGMAAISNAVVSICESGDNIISSRYLFGNTYSFFKSTIKSFGIETRFVDFENLDEIEASIDDKTRCIFIEVMTNPQLILFDVKKIATIAKKHQVVLMADNSILTPYIFQSIKYDIDIEVLSNTKFISGGATSIGGTVLTYPSEKWKHIPKLKPEYEKYGNEAFSKKLGKEIFRNFGGCLSPNSAYLQLLGLETITLRIDKISDNAFKIAKFLESETCVKKVDYPSLPNSAYFKLAQDILGGKSGSLINFELASEEICFKFIDNLKMIRRGTNFCDNKSMIIHPNSTIYCENTKEDKKLMKINNRMIRLSVGLEDFSDIRNDIAQALELAAS
jgi:O-acetylhomoserine (thiol)-lyase